MILQGAVEAALGAWPTYRFRRCIAMRIRRIRFPMLTCTRPTIALGPSLGPTILRREIETLWEGDFPRPTQILELNSSTSV